MKAKFIIPLIAVVLCLAFLLENLKVQRVLFGLALILITSLLWRTAVRLRRVRCDRGAPNPTVQRTGASRFAQRQIQRHRRLAPVADLIVRPLDNTLYMNAKTRSLLRFEYLAVGFLMVALAGVTADDFVSKGVKLRYVVEGQGPPVVLIHGLTLDVESQWADSGIIKALALDYRVIAIDCRGHGKSDKPHEPAAYGIEMVEDVCRLLDHLKIKKAHIVGYSSGGSVALKLLVTHPEQCSSVVLGDNAVYHEHYDFSAEDKAARNAATVSDPADVMPKPPPEAPPDVVRRREAWVRMPHDFKAYAAIYQSLSALNVTDAELRANQVPTLGLFCKADPRTVYLTAHLSNFKTAFIGGSHQDGFLRPEFISNLKAFLNAQRAKEKRIP